MRLERPKSGLKTIFERTNSPAIVKVQKMAAVNIIGFIEKMRFLPDSILVFVSEYKKGFKRKDGTIVDDKYMSWKTIWKPYFKNYINAHFSDGMLVEIKGEILPYAINHEKVVDGYSCIGQCINIFSYPRSSVKQEIRMIKESQQTSSGTPNLDAFNEPDF